MQVGAGAAACTIRNAACDLRKLRGKHLIGKPGRARRYLISPGAARIIGTPLTLREHVIAPLLADVADPRIRRTPRHWTDIDRHYQALRLEMMALFADLASPADEALATTPFVDRVPQAASRIAANYCNTGGSGAAPLTSQCTSGARPGVLGDPPGGPAARSREVRSGRE